MCNSIIFTFHSISQALKFEKFLRKNDISVKLRPVPRKISSSCGNCGYIVENDLDIVKKICEDNNIEYDEIYEEKNL